MSPRMFLILPAIVPFAIDVTLTLWGQGETYWSGDYQLANELAPVGRYLLTTHPLAFAGAAVVYACAFSLAIRFLPAWIGVWMSLGYLIAHASGANSWILAAAPQWEPVHNVLLAGFAAGCYTTYFRRRQREVDSSPADPATSAESREPSAGAID